MADAESTAKPPSEIAKDGGLDNGGTGGVIRVVAIGASAGGLDPIERFFDSMPTDSGLAFVIIQHLSPDFRSMMDQLVARHSTMSIVHAENGMGIRPNVVYLNPPRTDLTISEGKLYTRSHEDAELLALPIDSFFHSLAEDQNENAIGIILSGTGSDGSRGGQAIREAGGTLLVQEPSSAKFGSMPRAAVERGCASITALPEDMPGLLLRLIDGDEIDVEQARELDDGDPERAILSLLQRRYDADFGYYKQTTVRRRIRRRALLNQLPSIDDYLAMLRGDMEELEALYCDLLIGVTSFFRDTTAFDTLRDTVLPSIGSTMSKDRQLRVWIAGCASGEEAYSVAILLSEFARMRGLTLNVKIFATDIHFNSLEVASAGVYSKESLKGMPAALIEEYFNEIEGRYQVKQKLRKLVVFSLHNIIKDPPFTRMDLVTCRNLLIYLDDVAQRKVLALFHFALRKGGVLFLGPSETTSDFDTEFETLSKKWRMFKKLRDVHLRESTELLPLSSSDSGTPREQTRLTETRSTAMSNLQSATVQRQTLLRAYDKMLDKFAPASLLVDRGGDLIHIFGNADQFLALKSGVFSKSVVDVLVPDLKLVVSAGLERCMAQHTVPFLRKTTVRAEDGGESQVTISIEKLAPDGNFAEFLLVTMEEKKQTQLAPPAVSEGEAVDSAFYTQRVVELERDLKVTEESLQSTIEELETSNEELQATNEELMASNEELQSTNEELHSVNEELYTVSAEHQRKIEELTELTEDMDNLLRSTDIGTVFVDSESRIRRFTPSAAKTFNLVDHDIGRPLEHITYRFSYDDLIGDVERVRLDGAPVQQEISVDGKTYFLRILPYQSERDDIPGAVLTVVDIHELQDTQRQLAEQRKLYEQVVQEQSDLICRYRPDFKLTFVNDAFCRHFKKDREDLLGKSVLKLLPRQYHDPLKSQIAEMKPGETTSFARPDTGKGDDPRWLHFSRHALGDKSGKVVEFQAVGRDITDLKNVQNELTIANEKLAAEEERFRQLYRQTPVMMHSIDEDGVIVEASDHWSRVLGYEPEEVIGRKSVEFLTEASRRYAAEQVLPDFWKTGTCTDIPYQMVRKDGSVIDIRLSAITDTGPTGTVGRSLAVVVDVTDQLRAERELEVSHSQIAAEQRRLHRIYRNTPVMLHSIRADGEIVEVSEYWCRKMGYTPDEVIGLKIYDFMEPESAQLMQKENAPKLFDGRAVDNVDYVYVRKDGTPMEIRLSAITAPGTDGETLQTFSVVFDVTELRNAERAMEAQNAELARINNNLNQFAHIVSHDLTGPLRAIEHTANWIEEDAPPENRKDIQAHIDRLRDQTNHLGSLISDLVDYSRAGSVEHAIEPVDLGRALNDIFGVIEKPDQMKLVLRALPDEFLTQRAPILLVFRNLIENAVKYHDRNKGKITVVCKDMGNHWLFSVEDDGPGIDPKFHEKIMLPFRKLERKDSAPGNGMGLALVKKAIESNGGRLRVVSYPIERPGTRFVFDWPKSTAKSAAA